MAMKCIVWALVSVGLVATVVGCADQTAEPTREVTLETPAVSTDEDHEAEDERPVIATDQEALLSGAGPVDADAPDTFTETESGLKYRILRESDGKQPTADDAVTVHYRGWLDDGTEFDCSYARGEPISFPLSDVIRGWTEGMQLIGTGGMVELWIPPDLGYGASGFGNAVPPNATLHFLVELIAVK